VTHLRATRRDDLPRVLEVYAQGIATGDATFETELPERDALWERWLPGHAWVAELDGRVVGWAALTPTSARACYAGVAESTVYVDEAVRGRGVGRDLLRHTIVHADAGRLWTLQASVLAENSASLALHHAQGFRTVGVRERIARLHGTWRDTVLLERRRADD
jgi:L-amino acid N-acyltransferase YncA